MRPLPSQPASAKDPLPTGATADLRALTVAYLAASGFERQLQDELDRAGTERLGQHGRLILASGTPFAPAWAANIWHAPRLQPIESIAAAATALRAVQRNWAAYAPLHFRRASLIEQRLPHVAARPLTFGAAVPRAPLGSWTLLAPDRLMFAARCSSSFPHGEVTFVEDRDGPPNRAYLKLWELFARLAVQPRQGELCLDLGASPGGWSWVLGQLGARVIAVDKAALDARLATLPNVQWLNSSAFALEPGSFEPVDWLFGDIACYPTRLLGLVRRWLASGRVRNFVFTLKFQAATDHATAEAFRAIEGSQLFHLHHNKHELTWVLLADRTA